jgi:hypothetical protein
MAWTEYLSTDGSAPVLNGSVGTMNTVLRAILTTGYGAKPSAGWSEPFAAAANVAGFKAGGGLLKCYINVNDSAPRASPFNDARECRIKPSEAASALSTQTGLFPTAAQAANGLIIRKSATPDATARAWRAYADDRTLIMFIQSADYGNAWHGFYIGEIYSRTAADAFNGMSIGRIIEQIAATPTALPTQELLHVLNPVATVTSGHYIARSWGTNQAQSAVNVNKHGAGEHDAADMRGLTAFPNPVDGAIDVDPLVVSELITPTFVNRGRLRAMWHFKHPIAFVNDFDTFAGVGALAGRSFRLIKPTPNGLGAFVVETTTPDTN